ncbi:Muconolactone Delta-isomerase [Corynebacterium occultum]|uniref:Muconolactone Delta-isomerase n=1 Tax=Corynebacterium occultum TaxID=2675219 RepID=A0A6B8WNX9_9CORY|nr:muconolactone Delta-isomerase family protein [Corynebacterium occultum]QGU08068.1 Muconolactone Delta-isomerase [Corynebacterium occultum]
MVIFHVRLNERIPYDMDPELRADHVQRHGEALRELAAAGVLKHCWREAGTRSDIAVFQAADPAELHEILGSLPLFRFLTTEVTVLMPHPDLGQG